MYAALINLTIDPALAPAAAAVFSNDILPKLRAAPGIVVGYLLDPVDRQGLGFLLFETREQALSAAETATAWSAPGVTILKTEGRRVAATVP